MENVKTIKMEEEIKDEQTTFDTGFEEASKEFEVKLMKEEDVEDGN